MPPVLQLVQRPARPDDALPQVSTRDVYDLDDIDLDAYRGLALSAGCDQRFLSARRERISAWVRRGGTLLAHGHPRAPFVDALPQHRSMEFHTTRDLWLDAEESHPIWDGVDRRDVLFNTGVPGIHTFEELTRIGVAGFYSRSYFVDLPEGARVITVIGPGRLPVNVSYPLGDGEVILHPGNDLLTFARPGTTAADLGDRVIRYLAGDRAQQEAAR